MKPPASVGKGASCINVGRMADISGMWWNTVLGNSVAYILSHKHLRSLKKKNIKKKKEKKNKERKLI